MLSARNIFTLALMICSSFCVAAASEECRHDQRIYVHPSEIELSDCGIYWWIDDYPHQVEVLGSNECGFWVELPLETKRTVYTKTCPDCYRRMSIWAKKCPGCDREMT